MTTPTILITHDGNDITTKVLTYERSQSICTGVGNFNFQVEWKTGVNILEWDTIVLREAGRRKGTYFVSSTDKSAVNGFMDISCQDGSLKLSSYFISDIYNVNYQTYARYWIEKFLVEAKVDYSFTTESQGALLAENFPLGPASAYETIQTLLQNSGWYMYFDGDNTCIIGELSIDLSQVDKTLNDNDIISMLNKKDDKMLRNRAVVWGAYDNTGGGWAFADVTQHTPWDRSESDIRTVVLANSMIRSSGTAYSLAAKLLSEFAKISYTKELELPGEYNISIGDVVRMRSRYLSGNSLVTTVGSRASRQGLVTTLTLDQRCPRLFGYVDYLDFVYVGTGSDGVWRKPLDSNAWESFSTGIDPEHMYISDLIIKNGVFACVANTSTILEYGRYGWCYTMVGHIADWEVYIPVLTDVDGISFSASSFKAVAVDIDDVTNNILIGYRTIDPLPSGEYRSWVVEITPEQELISTRQVFIIDRDHQDFKLIDIDKYTSDRLCTAEAPFAYAPDDPQFWGDRKVYKIYDPEPKAKVFGPSPECETIDDPFFLQSELYAGSYYEDSTIIIEGNAISGFWSNSTITWFTYDYFVNDTRYNLSHPIEWPMIYGSPFGGDNNYLFSRIVYRKFFEAQSETSAEDDRMYHVCDMVKTGPDITLYHYQISPLVYGNAYKIQNVDQATTGNITLSGEQTIDGYMALAGYRILVKDQTDAKENGIYYVSTGQWTRSVDVIPAENCQNGMFVAVDRGIINRWSAWQVESDGFVEIGVDEIIFTQVLQIVGSNSISVGSEDQFHNELPSYIYFATTMNRIPRMRDGIIYYLYDGHVNINDSANPFGGYGTHYFYLFRYNIPEQSGNTEEVFKYDYTTHIGDSIVKQPDYQTHSMTELIPAGVGVGFFCFIWKKYPVWESEGFTLSMAWGWGLNSGGGLTSVWQVPAGLAPGPGCTPQIDAVWMYTNKTAWAGVSMIGENPQIYSFLKFHTIWTYEILYPCCLVPPGREAFSHIETQIAGVLELGSGTPSAYNVGLRGWDVENCTRYYRSNTFTPYEENFDYSTIEPLYIRDSYPPYFRHQGWYIYDATTFVGGSPLGTLNHTGLMSPHQDDFDHGIYIYNHPEIYKESIGGTTLATLNAETLYQPVSIYTKFLVTNGYFIMISQGYGEHIDAMFYGKLKDEYLFPGKDLCYLMRERKAISVIRGLDYEIKDFDFLDLSLENSQEYPLIAWTTGDSLITYSGCDGIIYSGGTSHLKRYDIELNNTVISGLFNDARVFKATGEFPVQDDILSLNYGQFIGVTDKNLYTSSIIPTTSIDSDDFITLVTLSGIMGKLEFSNSPSPYIFISVSGTGFYQRDPGGSLFTNYSPGGLFTSEIAVIRIDDRV